MFVFAIFAVIIGIYLFRNRKKQTPKNLKAVPVVKGSLPIVGHSLNFSKDIIGYIRDCYKTYGKIFKIKIFNKNIIVICDRSMMKEYFKATEEKMSLYEVLENLYFSNAFFQNSNDFNLSIQIIKRTVAVRFDEFIPKIDEEAMKMIESMKAKTNQKINLTSEMINFVANTSYRCFISNNINENFMEYLFKFTALLNQIVVLTYFLPNWFLKKTFGILLDYYRRRMIELIDSEIESYRKLCGKNDSMVIRKAIDFIDEKGNTLSNRQIGEIVICLLYVSSENTALGLSATLTEIAKNGYWPRIKELCEKYLADDNVQDLMSDEILNACVHEASRLNSHIFSLQRKPKSAISSIGGYHVGGVDSVAMCEPMLMSLDCSTDVFKNPKVFYPERYLKNYSNEHEPITANYVMTWGAQSHHLCPGKGFALLEIKMATALIVNNFHKFNITDEQYNNLDYFSPSAYAERKIELVLDPISIDEKSNNTIPNIKIHDQKIEHNGKKYIVKKLDGVILIKHCLNYDEQIKYFKYITTLSEHSSEAENIMTSSELGAYPIAYDNLVYTGTSNCSEPTELYQWAGNIIEMLVENIDSINCPPELLNIQFNSMYAQLFHERSTMKVHKDEHVTTGISISLGASCRFLLDNEEIILHSGDVIISDFSKINHGVISIIPESIPGWMSNDSLLLNPEIKLYGRKRMSIQLRHIDKLPEKLLTNDQFFDLI